MAKRMGWLEMTREEQAHEHMQAMEDITAALNRLGPHVAPECDYVHDPDDTDRPGSDAHTNNTRHGGTNT